MKHRIAFFRNFTRGPLAGVSASDSIEFVNRDSAARWIRGIRANSRAGVLNYTIGLIWPSAR